MIQYSVVLFCVLCSRPWSDTVRYCCIVLCAVFQAIKTDVVRSLCTRCELLSEDLELTDEISGEFISVCRCWSRDICHQVGLCAVI